MPIPNTLPLSDIIDVLVSVASSGVAGPTFNIGLILDTEGIIPTVGANARIREYTSGSWSESMIADGFGLTSKAYIAAGLYFSQKSQPRILYVGAQDKTAGGIVSAKINAAGTGYAVGDVLTPTQAGSSGGEFTVTQVDSNGAIIQGYVSAQGDTYSVALALPTTVAPVGGTGATIDIEAVGPETLVQAAAACRIANYNWYGFYVPGAETADHLLLAAWAQAASPQVQYFLNTADATVPGGIAGNLFATLYGAKYDRTIGIYSTTQNGAYPNNNYAGAALMGQAMGLFTGLSGCAFTLMGKPLTGIYTEPITETSLSYIHSVGGNVYVSRQNAYSEVENGRVFAPTTFYDQILYRASLASDIQYNIMNLLTGSPKIPQTNMGQARLLHAVDRAAQKKVDQGFLAAGVWIGPDVLNLKTGDPLSAGYLSQSESYVKQDPADTAARKAMPIYLTVIEAGAVNSIVVAVDVQV